MNAFRQSNNGSDPVRNFVQTNPATTPLLLTEFWVNYQYQTDFNPFHFHGGVYSFAIWMKIPTEWEDQCKLPQFQDIKKERIEKQEHLSSNILIHLVVSELCHINWVNHLRIVWYSSLLH